MEVKLILEVTCRITASPSFVKNLCHFFVCNLGMKKNFKAEYLLTLEISGFSLPNKPLI